MKNKRRKLGELLIEAGLIDNIQLNAALAYQKEWGGKLGAALIRKGFVTENDMISVIEKQMDMKCLPLEAFEMPTDEMMRILKEPTARKFGIFPVNFDGKTLAIATSDPTDLKTMDDLGFLLGVRVKPVLALESDILAAIDHFYNPKSSGERLQRTQASLGVRMPKSDSEFEIIRPFEEVKSSLTVMQSTKNDTILSGLIELLMDKGIITREELEKKVFQKKQ